MFTVRAKGVPFEVTSDSVLENQYDSLNGFVLNIAMLGQIFNITPSDKALLPWAALAFLLL